jgi:hypothetical protein
LQIINISDPAHPHWVGRYDTPYLTRGIFVLGEYAYVADDYSGLQIINVSNPANPIFAGNYDSSSRISGVYVRDNYAYASDIYLDLQILDVSYPANPILIGSYEMSETSMGIYISGNFAYMAETHWGLQIIDISDLANPIWAGGYDTPGISYSVYVSGDYIYIADEDSLQILRFNPTGVDENNAIPKSFSLSQNYPNPFNPTTQIKYSLPKDDDINISIYNLLGQMVVTLLDGKQKAGEHSIRWDGRDFPSGVYFARLVSGGKAENIRMVLIK